MSFRVHARPTRSDSVAAQTSRLDVLLRIGIDRRRTPACTGAHKRALEADSDSRAEPQRAREADPDSQAEPQRAREADSDSQAEPQRAREADPDSQARRDLLEKMERIKYELSWNQPSSDRLNELWDEWRVMITTEMKKKEFQFLFSEDKHYVSLDERAPSKVDIEYVLRIMSDVLILDAVINEDYKVVDDVYESHIAPVHFIVVDRENRTAFHHAAIEGQWATFKKLLEYGDLRFEVKGQEAHDLVDTHGKSIENYIDEYMPKDETDRIDMEECRAMVFDQEYGRSDEEDALLDN